MTIIRQIGKATLRLGDCVEFMRGCADGEFDLAIVDPPYAVGATDGVFGRGGRRSWGASEYRPELTNYAKHDETPDAEYFEQLFRVSKHQIIWGANYYPEPLWHSGWIVWDKVKASGVLSECELAFQSVDKVCRIFRHEWEGYRRGVRSFEATLDRTIHPNQKPVRLYDWCLEQFARPGYRILDTHLGSASSAVAANDAGYELVGIELHPEYFEAACVRLDHAIRQERLFA